MKDIMVQSIKGLPDEKILSFKISKLDFPPNPLDALIEHLGGAQQVAESVEETIMGQR